MFYEIRKISQMKSVLNKESIKTLVISLVLSRLDYCNSLLAGLSDENIQKLQKVQNYAARLVLGKSKSESATEMLQTLHWLPVKARIEYKIAVLCFNALQTSEPLYLKDLLCPYAPTRDLRSQNSKFLEVPRSKLKRYGDRAFSIVGPSVWNSLPFSLRSACNVAIFKRHLKTYLFTKYFSN